MTTLHDKVTQHYAEQARLAELAQLQRELADEAAAFVLQCNWIGAGDEWFQPIDDMADSDRTEWDRALRYLTLRGLVEVEGKRVRFIVPTEE